MRSLLLLVLVGAAQGWFLDPRDSEACVIKPEAPKTRFIDATVVPQAILSPNYNNSDPDAEYPDNTLCRWQVRVNGTDTWKVSVFNLDIENATDCRFDSLEIFSGTTNDPANSLLRVCGTYPFGSGVDINGEDIFIQFESNDNGIVGNGFALRAGKEITNDACDGAAQDFISTADTKSFVFMSRDFPANYLNNELCAWNFIGLPGENIRLGFTDFELEDCCSCDHLQLYATQYIQTKTGQGAGTEIFTLPSSLTRWPREE
uniref:CUB domain-containing protein AR26 n=1 Tax=Pectinaria gouldii TaxID=260746 RepID=V5L1T1_PECGU|nr:CUB domain-containing protein AR26 [Pectinaria gouldii]